MDERRRWVKQWLLWPAIPVLLALAWYVSRPRTTTAPSSAVDPPLGILRVTPFSPFAGDLGSIEPHLNLTAGFFKLSFSDKERPVKVWLELWKNGKKSETLNGSATVLKKPGECSVSLREGDEPKENRQFHLTFVTAQNGNRAVGTTYTDVPKTKLGLSMPKSIVEPLDLSVGQEKGVWAYMRGPMGVMSVSEPIEDSAKRYEWAIILKAKPLQSLKGVRDEDPRIAVDGFPDEGDSPKR